MLKRLFLVIFILQTFATSAWAGIDMSKFNQAEKSKMQIMHELLQRDEMSMHHMQDMHAADSTPNHSAMQAMMDCDQCDLEANCHNLLCTSIQALTSFDLPVALAQPNVIIVSHLATPFNMAVAYSNSQPEIHPPSV